MWDAVSRFALRPTRAGGSAKRPVSRHAQAQTAATRRRRGSDTSAVAENRWGRRGDGHSTAGIAPITRTPHEIRDHISPRVGRARPASPQTTLDASSAASKLLRTWVGIQSVQSEGHQVGVGIVALALASLCTNPQASEQPERARA